MERDAWLASDEDPSSDEKYAYYLMRDPNMREFTGPREDEHDPVTGTVATFRRTKIAMVRGQKPENMIDAKVYLAFDGKRAIPHRRIASPKPLQGWYQGGDEARRGSRVRPCEADAVLTQPYGGSCAVACYFCYVDAGVYGGRASGLMSVPLGYGDYVAKQIGQMRQAAPFYLSSFTDPFLPGLEDFYHNTENAMRAIARSGLPMFTLSRVAYPAFAYELLRLNPHSYAQKSINTPDEGDWKKLSPGAITLAEHFEEIRELRRQGIFVSIQVNPIIAGITSHEDVELLLEKLAEAGAKHVIFKFVETSQPMAKAMVEKTILKFGENRAAAFRDLFVENNCGAQKTVVEEYRREGFRRYTAKATALGMTAALCYEYGRDPTHPTGWRSLGPEYKTTPNCHGPSSVIYTRSRTHGDNGKPVAFREVADCPPSGCLSCAGENGGTPRCGNETMGRATAKVLADFKKPVYT